MCSVYKVDQNKVTIRVYVKDTNRSLTLTSVWVAPGPQLGLRGIFQHCH